VLLSGTAGTGKTSLAAHLADATCRRGGRCLFFSFEESPAQIIRNMGSINIGLETHVRSGLLKFHSSRPTMHGLEMHLVRLHKLIEEFNPAVVILDPVSNLHSAGSQDDSHNMLIRLIDFLRKKQITGFLVSLSSGAKNIAATDEGMSSIVDTWLLVRDIELNGERNRALYVLKARGLAHSNQVREFRISTQGIRLVPVYIGAAGVLTGSARLTQEALEQAEQLFSQGEIGRQQLALNHRRKAVESQIEALRAGFKAEEQEFGGVINKENNKTKKIAFNRQAMAQSRNVTVLKKGGRR
jgi:circadian clock protein KaiC